MSEVNVIKYTKLEELEIHAKAWNTLSVNSDVRHPGSSYAWISSYLQAKQEDGEDWMVLMAFKDNVLIGTLSLLIRYSKILFFKIVYLRTPFDAHSFSADFLAAKGEAEKVLQAFATSLKKEFPRIVSLQINKVLPLSNAVRVNTSNIKGIVKSSYPIGFVSNISINTSFEDYYAKVSERQRRYIKKSLSHFSNLPGYTVRKLSNLSAEFDEFKAFTELEKLGWKGKKGSAIANKKDFFDFFSALVGNLSQENYLEWFFLTIEGKIIAAFMNVNFGQTCYLLKTSYDEDYKNYNPGQLLLYLVIKEKFENGSFTDINFMSDYEWQNRWNVEKLSYINVSFFFNNLFSLFLARIPSSVLSRSPFLRKLSHGINRRLNKILRSF
jgi:Acetyltransferase (GNAT) domain